MKRKVVTYVRVSTEEQAKQGYSIPAQHQILQDYAKGHDLEIVRAFEESQSAFKPGRIRFKEMLAFLKKHKDVTAVLCYKIDRISRNMTDYSLLDEMEGVDIISATESLPENSTGKLIGTVQAAFARFYSEQLGERVKLGMETKVKSGYWPTRAPIGYVNDRDTRGILPDPKRAELIHDLFETYLTGVPLSQLVKWAASRGLKTRSGLRLARSEIHKMLNNPVYYGMIPWNGKIYKGKHRPLVSKSLFDRVQQRLRRGGSRLENHVFPYRGLLQCGYCGCKITASLEKKQYIYYHCTHGRGKCPQPYMRQEHIGSLLESVVDRVHLSKTQIATLLEVLKNSKTQHQEQQLKTIKRLKREETKINERREALYIDKLDSKISEDRWLELEGQWSARIDDINREIELLASEKEPLLDDVQATFELLQRGPELYLKQDHSERARLLKVLLSNCYIKGDSIDPIYKKPFDLVAIGAKKQEWWACLDSNQGPPAYQASALTS
jgi:site-specific DNA recombinase